MNQLSRPFSTDQNELVRYREDGSSELHEIEIAFPRKGPISYLSVKYWERQERALREEFRLTNFADVEVDTRLVGKGSESNEDAKRYLLGGKRFNAILRAKESYYGTGSPEVVDTLILASRLDYFRLQRRSCFSDRPDLREVNARMDRAVTLVESGLVSLSDLSVYPEVSRFEERMGARFLDIATGMNSSEGKFLESIPLRLERVMGSRHNYSRHEAIAYVSPLIEKLKPELHIEDLSEGVSPKENSSPLMVMLADLLVDRVDDQLCGLTRRTELLAFSLGSRDTWRSDCEWSERRRQEARRYLEESGEICTACEEDLSMARSILRQRNAEGSQHRIETLQALLELNSGRFEEALNRIESGTAQCCPPEQEIFSRYYAHELRNIGGRFRQREWLAGAETAYRMSIRLRESYAGPRSAPVASVMKDLGHLYLGGSGFYERFVHSQFGQGDPDRTLDLREILDARECFAGAAAIYSELLSSLDKAGNESRVSLEFELCSCEWEVKKIDNLLAANGVKEHEMPQGMNGLPRVKGANRRIG